MVHIITKAQVDLVVKAITVMHDSTIAGIREAAKEIAKKKT